MIYTLFGVGGSLLALRSRAEMHDEQANYYFTVSLLGIVAVNALFIGFTLICGNNLMLMLNNVPKDIFDIFLVYNNIIIFYFPFLSYILTLGYFVRSDGFPKLPFYALLISNLSNIVLSFLFMGVFHFGVEGSALGSVMGYAIGSVYISKYFFMENREYYIVTNFGFIQSIKTVVEFIKNTPEIISRLFLSFKMTFYTFLCAHYLGVASLMAFLV